MKIATWNVNSLRARQGFVTDWLAKQSPDICCLQETKMSDEAFPHGAFAELGYESLHHGNGRWNGVAILSKLGIEDARRGFVGEDPIEIAESRIVSARCGGIRVVSVYVPNGRDLASEHYAAKLAWLQRLRAELDAAGDPQDDIAICGDFNIAPSDADVWDIAKLDGMTHVSAPERSAFCDLVAWGLVDALRQMHPDEPGPYTWWDYRAGAFHRGWGMRIDHVLLSHPLAERLRGASVDRDARKKGTGSDRNPSDHAPVVVDLAPYGDS